MPSVCTAVGLLILLKLCPVFTFLQQLMTKICKLFTHTLVLQCLILDLPFGFPINNIISLSSVLHRRRRISPRRPMYLLIVGSYYCVMRFACALHMRQQNLQNLVPFPCLYIELFELVIEVIFHYCTTPPCHKIDLFKRPFLGSRFERLDDASVLLVFLISGFLYPQEILISVRI